MKRKFLGGATVYAILMIVGAWIAHLARQFPRPEGAFTGPGSVPGFLAYCLIALAAAGLLRCLRRRQRDAPAADEDGGPAQLLLLTGLVAAYLIVMPFAGFISSSAALCALTMRALGYRNPVRALAFGFILAFMLYLVFGVLMQVSLPKGWIG